LERGGKAVEHHDILRTLAEVATAFAGFTGIVVVLGGRDRREWRSNDTTAVIVLLASSLGVVFFAFIPDLARAAHLEPSQAWRVSTLLFATYHLLVILGSIRSRKLARGEPRFGPRVMVPVTVPIGLSIILAQFLTGAGVLSSWLFFFYLLGLLWMLAIATIVFAVLLLETLSSRPAA
jgi:hypothetical protein